jgi:hypothetical protein
MERNLDAGMLPPGNLSRERSIWPTSMPGWAALALAWLALVALAAIRSGVLPGAGDRHSAHWYRWEQTWVWLVVGAAGAICAGLATLEDDRAIGTILAAIFGTLGVVTLVITFAF